MKILNWVHRKLHGSVDSHDMRKGIMSETTKKNKTDKEGLLGPCLTLENVLVDDILTIGTFGFGQQLNASEKDEEGKMNPLVVKSSETELQQKVVLGTSKPTINSSDVSIVDPITITSTIINKKNTTSSSTTQFLNQPSTPHHHESRKLDLDDDKNTIISTKRITLADLFLAEEESDHFISLMTTLTDSGVVPFYLDKEPAVVVHKKNGPISFTKKLLLGARYGLEEDSRLPRKLHRLMVKMLRKKKKIHPGHGEDNEVHATDGALQRCIKWKIVVRSSKAAN